MKSRTTAQFRKLFSDLPKQVQQQARAAYRQFQITCCSVGKSTLIINLRGQIGRIHNW